MRRRRFYGLALAAVLGCGQEASGPSAPVPEVLLLLGGDAQTGAAGKPLDDPLIVAVFDYQNIPIEGVTVAFFIEMGSGTISPQNVVTGANGTAQARWTLGGAGNQRASASVTRPRGDPLRATFLANIVEPGVVAPSRPALVRTPPTRARTD